MNGKQAKLIRGVAKKYAYEKDETLQQKHVKTVNWKIPGTDKTVPIPHYTYRYKAGTPQAIVTMLKKKFKSLNHLEKNEFMHGYVTVS